jgi:hypothetical protein
MGNDKGGASNGDLATEFAEEVSKCTQKVSVVKDQVRIVSVSTMEWLRLLECLSSALIIPCNV